MVGSFARDWGNGFILLTRSGRKEICLLSPLSKPQLNLPPFSKGGQGGVILRPITPPTPPLLRGGGIQGFPHSRHFAISRAPNPCKENPVMDELKQGEAHSLQGPHRDLRPELPAGFIPIRLVL